MMLAPETLIQQGWQERAFSEYGKMHDNALLYCIIVSPGKFSIGIEESEDIRTPVFEGKISDEEMLGKIISMTIDTPEDDAAAFFDVISWLGERGWEREDHRICRKELGETVYTCTEMDEGCYIIDVQDEFDEEEYDLFNGSILSEEQALMILEALELD